MNQATQLVAGVFSFFILFPQKREGNNSPIRLTPHEWTKFTRMEFFQKEKGLPTLVGRDLYLGVSRPQII